MTGLHGLSRGVFMSQTTTMICDQCGKESRWLKVSNGVRPEGWLSVGFKLFTGDSGSFDFCSVSCAITFLSHHQAS